MIYSVISAINIVLDVVWWMIIVQVILSWLIMFNVVNMQSGFVPSLVDALDKMTEPFYRPIRKLLPPMSGLDFAPLILLVIIMIIQSAILPGILAEVGPTIT